MLFVSLCHKKCKIIWLNFFAVTFFSLPKLKNNLHSMNIQILGVSAGNKISSSMCVHGSLQVSTPHLCNFQPGYGSTMIHWYMPETQRRGSSFSSRWKWNQLCVSNSALFNMLYSEAKTSEVYRTGGFLIMMYQS